jgi:AcrR family transcriptional regulator
MGRPRDFNVDEALDRALAVFWRKGYEGASLSDLTRAMRINRPSLYAAFGNKEALFRKVLDRYAEGPAAYFREALAEPTAGAVVERLWRTAIDRLTDPRSPRGCLMVQSALACGDEAEPARREVAARRAAVVVALRERFARAVAEGDLPALAAPAALARYVAAVNHGMAIQAADGASREEMEQVVEMALRTWHGEFTAGGRASRSAGPGDPSQRASRVARTARVKDS